jgi:tetratricopeptide (TPR) repeat protein
VVCEADVERLGALLDKSLIRRRDEPDGTVRFWMLETIREFAGEHLRAHADVAAQVGRRHAEWILELARGAHLSSEEIGRARPDHRLALGERDEIRAALDWAEVADPGLAGEIVVALEQHWTTSAPEEGRRRVEHVLNGPDLPPGRRAQLLRLEGGLAILLGERERGERSYAEALELFRELGDDVNAVALLARFAVHAGSGDAEVARQQIAEVRALNARAGNPVVEPQLLGTEAHLAERAGDLEEALRLYRSAFEAANAAGFTMWAMWTLADMLHVELALGQPEAAEGTGREALRLAVQLEDDRIARMTLVGLARVALERGDVTRAGTYWGAVEGAERTRPLASRWDGFEDFAAPLATRDDERFRAAAATGAEQAFDRIVALALGEPPQTVP